MAEKYNLIQSVIRATTLLEHIAREGHSMGISQISKNVGLHKSTCFGILYTLETLGYVIRDDEGRYSLTARVCDLSDGYLRNVDLRQIALPHLRDEWPRLGRDERPCRRSPCSRSPDSR